MICHHPHLGEGSRGRNTGRGGVNRVRLAGRDGRGAQRDASMADSRLQTEDNVDNVGWIKASEDGGGAGACRQKDTYYFPELFKSP